MFKGAIATVSEISAPAHRAEALAGVYLAAYLGLAGPVIGLGVADPDRLHAREPARLRGAARARRSSPPRPRCSAATARPASSRPQPPRPEKGRPCPTHNGPPRPAAGSLARARRDRSTSALTRRIHRPGGDGQPASPTRLLDAGHRVYATNRTAAKAQPLIERGLVWRATPREVAASADVVLSMVSDDHALDAISTGPDGLLAGLQPGRSTST